MSDSTSNNFTPSAETVRRCPYCDSVVAENADICLMCGRALVKEPTTVSPPIPTPTPPVVQGKEEVKPSVVVKEPETAVAPPPPTLTTLPPTPEPEPEIVPEVVTAVLRERESWATFGLTAVFSLIIFVLGVLVLEYQSPTLTVALVPSPTPIPPTPTYTPTLTPLPTETPHPTETPTLTPTPAPTDTPRPDRFHGVGEGDTLIALSLLYRVSAESIAAANSLTLDSAIQLGQNLVIPWPTATPALQSMIIQVNGQNVIANVDNCEIYIIQPGDTAFVIAATKNVPLEAIIAVNRQTEESIGLLQPGDALCIPRIDYTDTLPPTPGPSPTPSATSLPPGPHLLYPIHNAIITPPDQTVALQWTAVKDLAPDEWYMVELADLSTVDNLPKRGFTRDNAFQLPSDWRPQEAATHLLRWQVSIIHVTKWRADGLPIYTYGGASSEPHLFYWLGAVPTPTPTPTLTPSPTAVPQP